MSDNDPFRGEDTVSSPSGEDVHAAPQGFLERLSNSFGAILMGLLLVPLACWGLFWNEGRAVKTARALEEGQGLVQSIGTQRRDPAFDGKLVHVTGEVRSAGGVQDDLFGIRSRGLKLSRKVEMLQWVEKESGSGQDRKFTYSQEWSDRPVDSSRFRVPQGHQNPPMRWSSESFFARDAKIEAYPIGNAIQRLSGASDFRLDPTVVETARRRTGSALVMRDGMLFLANNQNGTQVGSLRVSYQLLPEGTASFVGRQTADGIEPYRARNGRDFLLAAKGTRTTDEMFETAQQDNVTLTWILRAVGLLVMFIGFSSLFAPVTLLSSYVPLLGSLVSGAVGLVAAAATAILGPAVIAVAWFAYRPLVSIIVLAIGFGLAFGFRMLRQRRQAVAAQGAPA
ncbi:TMEM43 family protein [Rhabdaerophilum sp. SD176]|uniref:TMEM43 family protein n=1 Tax=Rhabdaerophilum sp. SD176 TaxID=2983548 RepID=UPI0024DFA24B|nr:TMEM43 family protein [Rhabdaerophilum sp. SD176]